MGRLYEQIRKDIEKLRQVDEAIKNNQLVSMDDVFNVSIALKKIEYIITYAESEEPELLKHEGRFPLGDLTHFNLPEQFEALVDGWEEALGEQRVNHAIDHLQKQSAAEAYVPEITPHNPTAYAEYVQKTIKDIAHVSQEGHFGISRDGVAAMAVSAQQGLVKTIFEQDFAFDPNNQDNRPILDFIDNPISETIEAYQNPLMLNGDQDIRDFLRAHQPYYNDIIRNSEHPRPFDAVTQYYPVAHALLSIHEAKWNPAELSKALKDSVANYAESYKGRKNEMNVGAFISLARDRIESSLLDHAVILGKDPDSKFLKDFFHNPVQTMEKHFNDLAADINSPKAAQSRAVAEKIHGQEANYNQAHAGKPDRIVQIEARKQSRFEDLFAESNPHFDPATFKHQYQGNAFERFLGRTSQEWNDMANYIDTWQALNEDRNLDKAADLAEKYLVHKFPGVDPKNITPEMCRGLRGAGKERSLFCLSLVQSKAAAEDQVNQEIYDEANRRFNEYERRLHRDENFQDKLAGDLEQDNVIDQAQNGNEISNESVIENNNIIPNN